METHPIAELMDVTMQKLKEIVDVNTIIGSPVTVGDGIKIIPISKVSFGMVSGGSDFSGKNEKIHFGGGSGAGVSVSPVGFLVIERDEVRMLSVSPGVSGPYDKAFEMVPAVLDKITSFIDEQKAKKKQSE